MKDITLTQYFMWLCDHGYPCYEVDNGKTQERELAKALEEEKKKESGRK